MATTAIDIDPRKQALSDILDAANRKVIVFAAYKSTVHNLAKVVKGHGRDVQVVTGDTPAKERVTIFERFQSDPSGPHLVAHPGCMAHGVTLTAANIIVWWGPVDDAETYQQANARIVRPGQTSKTLIVRLIGSKLERVVYDRLHRKQSIAGALLELFEQGTSRSKP